MARTIAQPESSRDEEAAGDDRLGLILQLLVVQGEQTRSILQVLTAEKPSDGPSLATQVGVLIDRLDDQTRCLKELTLAISKLGRDLPDELVAAISVSLDTPPRNGSVHPPNGHDRT